MASIPNKKMRGRAILVAALLIIVGFGLVIHQLYRVQLVEGESYKQEAMSRQLRATTINANRGTIYSADGQILAASATSWRVIFSPADTPMSRQHCWRWHERDPGRGSGVYPGARRQQKELLSGHQKTGG